MYHVLEIVKPRTRYFINELDRRHAGKPIARLTKNDIVCGPGNMSTNKGYEAQEGYDGGKGGYEDFDDVVNDAT